jgi:ABC-type Mn2+/Zn2+ transport system permease subunit
VAQYGGYKGLGYGRIVSIFRNQKNSLTLEAWIGCSFVLTASLGLWLVASSPHAAEHLKEILMGQILWVTLIYYAAAGVIWAIWRKQFYSDAICVYIHATCSRPKIALQG